MYLRKQIKIGIIHPQLIAGGGSEARALYIADALKNEYEVTLLTLYSSDLDKLNECFGTNLQYEEIRIIEHTFSNFFRHFYLFDALRGAIFARFCRNFIDSFDLIISTYNIMNFNKRGIQFIADFSFNDNLRREFDSSNKSIFYGENLLRRIYLSLSEKLSGVSRKNFKKNLTIANSKWSAKVMQEVYGLDCPVIYPPVIGNFPEVKWNKRNNDFVYIGRLSPEKRIGFIIEVLDMVRKQGFDFNLHIIGRLDNSTYVRKLKETSQGKGTWIKFEGLKYKDEKMKLLSKCKYGISARPKEPFGISIAEMVKAGEIVWVPNGGGQVEIVNHPDLLYNNIEDAVNKIEKVFKDETLQIKILKHLAKQAERFSTERFKVEIKNIVEQFLVKNEKI